MSCKFFILNIKKNFPLKMARACISGSSGIDRSPDPCPLHALPPSSTIKTFAQRRSTFIDYSNVNSVVQLIDGVDFCITTNTHHNLQGNFPTISPSLAIPMLSGISVPGQ